MSFNWCRLRTRLSENLEWQTILDHSYELPLFCMTILAAMIIRNVAVVRVSRRDVDGRQIAWNVSDVIDKVSSGQKQIPRVMAGDKVYRFLEYLKTFSEHALKKHFQRYIDAL